MDLITLLTQARHMVHYSCALSLAVATALSLLQPGAALAAPARVQVQGPLNLGASERKPADVFGEVKLPPAIQTYVLLTDQPPETPDGVEYGPLLRSSLQALLGRHVRLEAGKDSAVVLEVERFGMSCQANAYKASCVAVLQAKLWMPKANLILLQDKWMVTTPPLDAREGLTGKSLQDGALEQHRRRLHGLSRAVRAGMEGVLASLNRDIERKQLVFDVETLRTQSVTKLGALWYRAAKAQVAPSADAAAGPTVQQIDAWIEQGGCESALGLPICLSSLLDKGLLTKADVGNAREASLRQAVEERLAVLFPGGVPSRSSVVVALQRAVYVLEVPTMTYTLLWKTDKDIRGLAADAAVDRVCVLLQDAGDAQALAQCRGLNAQSQAQNVALPAPVQADLVSRLSLERGWLVVALREGQPLRVSVAAPAADGAASAVPEVEVIQQDDVWLARPTKCPDDLQTQALSYKTRAQPVVLGPPRPVERKAELNGLLLEVLTVSTTCSREVLKSIWDMAASLTPPEAGVAQKYRARRDAMRDWRRLTSEDAEDAMRAQQAAERAAREAAEAKDRAQRKADSAKLLSSAQKAFKQGKLNAAFEAAYAACQRDEENAEACALTQTVRQRMDELERQRVLRAQAAAEERVLRQVPQLERRCMAAYSEYLRAQQYARSAAAAGGSRSAAAAERALQRAVVKVRESQSGLRAAILIYQQRGMQQAAVGVRERASGCLRL